MHLGISFVHAHFGPPESPQCLQMAFRAKQVEDLPLRTEAMQHFVPRALVHVALLSDEASDVEVTEGSVKVIGFKVAGRFHEGEKGIDVGDADVVQGQGTGGTVQITQQTTELALEEVEARGMVLPH